MADAIGFAEQIVSSSTGTVNFQDMSIPTGVDVTGAMVLMSGDSSGSSTSGTASWGATGAAMSIAFLEKVGSNATSALQYVRAMDNLGFPFRKQNFRQTVAVTTNSASAPAGRLWANADTSSPTVNLAVDFSAWMTKGLVLDFTNVDAVSVDGEDIRVMVVLFAGFTNFSVADASPGAEGFNPDAWMAMCSHNGGSPGGDLTWGWGAAARVSSTITQAAGNCNWPRKTGTSEASEAFGLVRNNAYTCGVTTAGAEETAISIDTTSGAGWTEAGSSFIDRGWVAMEFSDDSRVAAVAVEELDGSTGVTPFTGLGLAPDTIIGWVIPATSENTVIGDASSQSTVSMFVISGTTCVTYMMAQSHGITNAEAETFSGRDSSGITVLEHDGSGVRFQMSSVTRTETGFSGTIDTGMTGRMVVFGIGVGEVSAQDDEEVHVDEEVLIRTAGPPVIVDETVQVSDMLSTALTMMEMDGSAALDMDGRVSAGGGETGYIAGGSQNAPGRVSRGGGETGYVASDGISGE